MIFKVLFRVINSKSLATYPESQICKVIAVENGTKLENRIDNITSNLKADGYNLVELIDCVNISEPTMLCR